METDKSYSPFKRGASTDRDNYRPISVLPVASKLPERAVHHQLYSFCNENKLLSPFQRGFRENHPTEFAVVAFSDFVRHGVDQGLLTGAVFIDRRKAFDSVEHDLCINRLESYGFKDTELNWIKSYLSDRKQVVSVGKTPPKIFFFHLSCFSIMAFILKIKQAIVNK